MDDASVSSRLFVTRKLPWILAVTVFAVFLLTRNVWIGVNSLRPVYEAAGWGFENAFSQPSTKSLVSLSRRWQAHGSRRRPIS